MKNNIIHFLVKNYNQIMIITDEGALLVCGDYCKQIKNETAFIYNLISDYIEDEEILPINFRTYGNKNNYKYYETTDTKKVIVPLGEKSKKLVETIISRIKLEKRVKSLKMEK